jgi:hypothetical protein
LSQQRRFALSDLFRPLRNRSGLERRVAGLEAAWNNHIPSFLSAVTSVGAFGRELMALRRELERQARVIGELEAKLSPPPTGPAPQVVSPDKVRQAIEQGLRLQLAGDEPPLDGYVVVAEAIEDGADVIAPLDAIPFEAGAVRELRLGRLIDRLAPDVLRRRLLPHWRELLAPGAGVSGSFRDAEAMAAQLASGAVKFEDARAGWLELGADGFYRGAFFTRQDLVELFSEAGFVDIKFQPSGGAPHDLRLSARRP